MASALNSPFIGSIIFANNAVNLPPPEENTSSVLLYNTETKEEFWFANSANIDEIHEQTDRVVALEPIPDIGLGLVFPHGVQFGWRHYLYPRSHGCRSRHTKCENQCL